jgi:hypothetical protein
LPNTFYRLQRERFGDNGDLAKRYDFLRTGDDALDEFGAGVSLYFKSLKTLAVVFLLCALISLVAVGQNQRHQVGKAATLAATEVPVYDNTTRHDIETPLRLLGMCGIA